MRFNPLKERGIQLINNILKVELPPDGLYFSYQQAVRGGEISPSEAVIKKTNQTAP